MRIRILLEPFLGFDLPFLHFCRNVVSSALFIYLLFGFGSAAIRPETRRFRPALGFDLYSTAPGEGERKRVEDSESVCVCV